MANVLINAVLVACFSVDDLAAAGVPVDDLVVGRRPVDALVVAGVPVDDPEVAGVPVVAGVAAWMVYLLLLVFSVVAAS